ncbi:MULTISPECIES: hypothetical protein [Paenibacillus]|uniref:hypothetical protein n=1 Tax=Paenibacillus TaxID=44249 RepID=UPI001D75E82C|nr:MULTISPECIES: hypothetical protein [Paenibacillus]MBZ6443870.1 hypothetical protein [Paenibacillus polymyxa]MBZ6451097.1 hypothetical protein [Paenibacillus polymyxa]MEE4578377.1 hypothetical protein [Paenibacillus polymyxa]UMR35522.1 hypothetical protein MJ749_23300 [Paenibacillus polymyxa]
MSIQTFDSLEALIQAVSQTITCNLGWKYRLYRMLLKCYAAVEASQIFNTLRRDCDMIKNTMLLWNKRLQ